MDAKQAATTEVPSKRPRENSQRLEEKDGSPATKRAKVEPETGAAAPDQSTRKEGQEETKEDASAEQKPGLSKGGKGRQPQGKKKEKGRDRRRGTRGDAEASKDGEDSKVPRLPKRQCALLIGFCGAGYNGMQIQPDPKLRTIEGMLFNALVEVGAVSKDNADDPVKVGLGRAARTDAGVHAAGNVVSMKLITAVPGVADLVARINEVLPPEIRLWSILRAQNAFNARTTCDSRKYTYFFPSYLMIPPKPGSGLHGNLRQNDSDVPPHAFWASLSGNEGESIETSHEEDLRRKRTYRMPAEQVEALRAAARKFEGSHNFHNFTVGRDFRDRSCVRHMISIKIADPVVYGDTEWVNVLFHGQSFMLHQRKMMSALVLACRTGSPPEIIEEIYGPRMIFVPKMPALGLLLEYPIFDTYTRKVSSVNEKLQPSDSEYRPPIDFELHREAIDEFKQQHIYTRMRAIEGQEGVFDAWIRSIDSYSGNDLLYLNSKGIIPAAAVIKKGERRPNPFREKRRFDATSFTADGGAESKPVAEDEEDEEGGEQLDRAKLNDMEG